MTLPTTVVRGRRQPDRAGRRRRHDARGRRGRPRRDRGARGAGGPGRAGGQGPAARGRHDGRARRRRHPVLRPDAEPHLGRRPTSPRGSSHRSPRSPWTPPRSSRASTRRATRTRRSPRPRRSRQRLAEHGITVDGTPVPRRQAVGRARDRQGRVRDARQDRAPLPRHVRQHDHRGGLAAGRDPRGPAGQLRRRGRGGAARGRRRGRRHDGRAPGRRVRPRRGLGPAARACSPVWSGCPPTPRTRRCATSRRACRSAA